MWIARRRVAVTEALAAASGARESDPLSRPSPGRAAQDETRRSARAKLRPIRARPYTLRFLIIDAHRNATKV